MYAVHAMRGPWTLMFHENALLQYFHESGQRGDDQVGSINWVMGMAQRDVGAGRIGFRGMFSLEPWTIRGCGYPDLLASGEQCNGQQIHDRQHGLCVPWMLEAGASAYTQNTRSVLCQPHAPRNAAE